jgi:hypothetical protein
MQLVKGNLWDEIGKADLILVTANSTLNNCGELVMGAGAALEAKKRWPWMPQRAGAYIRDFATHDGTGMFYGLMTFQAEKGLDGQVGLLQTKHGWRYPSSQALITRSLRMLWGSANSFHRIALNFPGIGLGGLKREDVLPLLEVLPDNVFVYEPLESTPNAQ